MKELKFKNNEIWLSKQLNYAGERCLIMLSGPVWDSCYLSAGIIRIVI